MCGHPIYHSSYIRWTARLLFLTQFVLKHEYTNVPIEGTRLTNEASAGLSFPRYMASNQGQHYMKTRGHE